MNCNCNCSGTPNCNLLVGESPPAVGKTPMGKTPVGKTPMGKTPVGKTPRSRISVAYPAIPELVSGGGGGSKSHKFKWLVKVGASKGVIRVD